MYKCVVFLIGINPFSDSIHIIPLLHSLLKMMVFLLLILFVAVLVAIIQFHSTDSLCSPAILVGIPVGTH